MTAREKVISVVGFDVRDGRVYQDGHQPDEYSSFGNDIQKLFDYAVDQTEKTTISEHLIEREKGV